MFFYSNVVGVVQLAEHQTVDLVVVGSSPITHPREGRWIAARGKQASVAQLDRAPDFESVGRRFESCRACI